MRPSAILSIIFLLSTAMIFVGVGVWDVVAIVNNRPDQTVSTVLRNWSSAFPILPFVFGLTLGLLMGHIFWPSYVKE